MAMTSTAFGVAMLGMTAASTALSVYGQIQQGDMQKQQADQQAYMQRTQAELANMNARQQAAQLQQQQSRFEHTQIAQAVASGVTLDSGSFMSIMADTASKAEQQRLNILRNGALAQAGGDLTAANTSNWGSMAQMGGYMGAGGALMSGASSAMGTIDKMGWFSGPTATKAAQ